MAEALLKAWNAPAVVTAVEIDAAKVQTVRTENTAVSDLKGSNGLTWTQQDKALPMPLNLKDPALKLAIQSSDFLQALDWQPLKVTGLKGQRYQLKIDGEDGGDLHPPAVGGRREPGGPVHARWPNRHRPCMT